jgi:hypothetical protein
MLATPAELRATAKKMDDLADQLEAEGRKVGAALSATASMMAGFRLAAAAVGTCGQLELCNATNVRDLRLMAQHLRTTADEYEQRNEAYTQLLKS